MAEILVVDDDDVIRETLCELLASDYHCQQVSTAEEALRRLEAHAEAIPPPTAVHFVTDAGDQDENEQQHREKLQWQRQTLPHVRRY